MAASHDDFILVQRRFNRPSGTCGRLAGAARYFAAPTRGGARCVAGLNTIAPPTLAGGTVRRNHSNRLLPLVATASLAHEKNCRRDLPAAGRRWRCETSAYAVGVSAWSWSGTGVRSGIDRGERRMVSMKTRTSSGSN